MNSSPFRVRKRNLQACRRCYRRKQKCIGFPTCANCAAANLECARSDPSRTQGVPERYHGMSKDALYSRIAALEAQLSADPDERESPASCTTNSISGNCSSSIASGAGGFSSAVDMLLLGHVVGSEPAHLGSSSGRMIARSLDLMVKNATWTNSLPAVMSDGQDPSLRTIQPAMEAASPTDIAGSKLIEAYSANSHRRLPFLDQSEILHLHMKRDQLLSSTSANPWDCFKLFMVYAIGSAMQKMTERYNSLSPEELFQTALKFKAPIMESRSVENIQAILLLIIYNLRTSSSSTIWYLIGLAMKTAIDLGLHREFNYHGLKPDQAQTKRRVFWSVYMLERHIAWSLGRPFGIAERDIDVGLPENFEKCLQVNGSAQLNADEEIRSLGPFIPSLQLARIRSRIHTKIYRVDKEVSTLLPLVGPLLSELEDYKRSIPPNLLQSDNEWLHMHWNNGVRMLLQPFLSELPPDHDLVRICIKASGQMCQLFKRLRQNDYLGYGYILVSFIFMSGLTISYCLFRCPRLWSVTVANDLRACSSLLFDVADRSVCLKTYRDIWENIVTTVMEYLGRVLDHSDLSIDGDSNGRSRSDVGTIEEFRTPAALDDWMLPAIVYEDLLPSGYIETTEGVTAPHILHDTSAAQNVQDIQFHQQQLSSFEYCWSNFDRNVRSQEQPDTRQYPPEIEQILAEDFWAGDSIRSQMLTELVSQSAILL